MTVNSSTSYSAGTINGRRFKWPGIVLCGKVQLEVLGTGIDDMDYSRNIKYTVRKMRREEYPLLNDFLYEAIYIPDGMEPPPKTIINAPELQVYVVDFGTQEHDKAFAADVEGMIAGATWVRIMNDYGHIDDDTPSLAISVRREYRGLGIGTVLLKELLENLTASGYEKVSLSVQKENYAVKMYEKAGFQVLRETDEEYIMVWSAKSK